MTDDFKDIAELKSRLRQMRQEVGECPALDTLASFALGKLNRKEADSVAKHIALCGFCDFATDPGGDTFMAHGLSVDGSRWAKFKGLLLRRLGAERANARIIDDPSVKSTWLSHLLRANIPAYLGIMALLWPAYVGTRVLVEGAKPLTAAPRRLGAANIAGPPRPELVQHLFLETERGKAPSQVFKRTTGPRFALLSFIIPAQPRRVYLATIVDQTGKEVFQQIRLQRARSDGAFELVCDLSQLPVGSYDLKIQEDSATSSNDSPIFLFPLEVNR